LNELATGSIATDVAPHLTHTLITGASAGLGVELARLFAVDGNPLVLTARNEDRLIQLADMLRRDHEIDVRVIACDLAAPRGADELLEHLRDEGVGVRVLVNNAGFGAYGPFEKRETDLYQQMVELNIATLTTLTRDLLPAMKRFAAARGVTEPDASSPGVLNVASTAAFQPGPLMAVYFATKSYVLSFTEALHEELRGSGVLATAFCPGPTRTEFFTQDAMIPAGDLTANDLAEYHRRDHRRMDAGLAARIGYRGFLADRAIVIPGARNLLMAKMVRFIPRFITRRLAHRMMKK